MDTARLNLEHLATLRDLELGYPLHEAVRYRISGTDMNVFRSPSLQEMVGQPGALSQDAFRTLVIRQGGIG